MSEEITPTPESVSNETTEQDVENAKSTLEKSFEEMSKIEKSFQVKLSELLDIYHKLGEKDVDNLGHEQSTQLNELSQKITQAESEVMQARKKFKELYDRYFELCEKFKNKS